MTANDGGYVYLLVECGDNRMYKIGVTKGKRVSDRIKKLQTGNGNKITEVTSFWSSRPFKLESMLHNRFYDKREEGEWFLLSEDDVKNFTYLCEMYQRNIDALEENPFF